MATQRLGYDYESLGVGKMSDDPKTTLLRRDAEAVLHEDAGWYQSDGCHVEVDTPTWDAARRVASAWLAEHSEVEVKP